MIWWSLLSGRPRIRSRIGQHADQVLPPVHDVDVPHLLQLFAEPAQLDDRLLDREIFRSAVTSVVMIPPAVSGGYFSSSRTSAASSASISPRMASCCSSGTCSSTSTRSSGAMADTTIDASAASMSDEHGGGPLRVHLRKDPAGGLRVEILRHVRRRLGRQLLQHLRALGRGDLLDAKRDIPRLFRSRAILVCFAALHRSSSTQRRSPRRIFPVAQIPVPGTVDFHAVPPSCTKELESAAANNGMVSVYHEVRWIGRACVRLSRCFVFSPAPITGESLGRARTAMGIIHKKRKGHG